MKFNYFQIPNKKVDVVIVDTEADYLMHQSIPDSASVQGVPIRNTIPWIMSFRFVVSFLKRFAKRNSLHSPTRHIGMSLIAAVIDTIKPKVMMSFIDTNNIIGDLQDMFPDKYALSVQNGLRTESENGAIGEWGRPHYILPNYYCFGQYEVDLIDKKGFRCKQAIPVGSLKMGLFLDSHNEFLDPDRVRQGFCFISPYMKNPITKEYEGFIEMGKQLYEMVWKYCSENKIEFTVVMRSERSSHQYQEEYDYFNKFDGINIIPNQREAMSTYGLGLSSELVIGMNSTLMFELFGAGTKVLFPMPANKNLRDLLGEENTYSRMPATVTLDRLEIDELKTKLDALLNMGMGEYSKVTESARDYYFTVSNDLHAHEIIKKDIEKMLE